MGSMQRIGDLELSQDLEFQRRSWRVQRIGQGVMLLVLLAAFTVVPAEVGWAAPPARRMVRKPRRKSSRTMQHVQGE